MSTTKTLSSPSDLAATSRATLGVSTIPAWVGVALCLLLAAGIPIVEHLTGLDQVPVQGFRFHAAPPRVEGMGTFPVRAFAIVGES